MGPANCSSVCSPGCRFSNSLEGMLSFSWGCCPKRAASAWCPNFLISSSTLCMGLSLNIAGGGSSLWFPWFPGTSSILRSLGSPADISSRCIDNWFICSGICCLSFASSVFKVDIRITWSGIWYLLSPKQFLILQCIARPSWSIISIRFLYNSISSPRKKYLWLWDFLSKFLLCLLVSLRWW